MKNTGRHIITNEAFHFMRLLSAIAILLLLFSTSAKTQTLSASEYQIKAVFLYNFSHFIDWPETAFENSYDPFVIGIIGSDPFGPYLEQSIKYERIRSHIMEVKHFDNIRDANKCHMLYINLQDPEEIKQALAAMSGRPILTVGDSPNFIRWGGLVRFYTEESKIRLEINNTVAKARKLQISSKLLRVAIVQ
ncbi:MAG: YfiR family protein [Bacteroidota bacterium]|nr:YfiR family protein [Bacteroidota bacterium]